jgi:hypothetical protein
MLILSIAGFVATLATPVVVLALWRHFEARVTSYDRAGRV